MRLLVVEDEIKTGDYLRQGLAEAGFQVSLVRNGLDGHHLAMTESFDLIVTAWMTVSRDWSWAPMIIW
jgi:two-component system copper resistance phosphate regulon response regulator CusR